jgi:hypothetical protein
LKFIVARAKNEPTIIMYYHCCRGKILRKKIVGGEAEKEEEKGKSQPSQGKSSLKEAEK